MALTPLKMNFDYEAVLSGGRPVPKLNAGLEFLGFYLADGPVSCDGRYGKEFLQKVEALRGRKLSLVQSKEVQNSWGPLADIEVERELNSKLLSAELTQLIAPGEGTRIFGKDSGEAFGDFPLLCKFPLSMSGRGNKRIRGPEDLKGLKTPYILEPLRKRVLDFSHFIYPEGDLIVYENLVDENFQYRGTVFHDRRNPKSSAIPFFKKIPPEQILNYEEELARYRSLFEERAKRAPVSFGYSIDSFVYEDGGSVRIRTCSEFNFRRTMGHLAHELGRALLPEAPWLALRLFFSNPSGLEDFARDEGLLLLSPSEARIQVLLLPAENGKRGANLLRDADRFDVHKLPDAEV